MNSNQKILEPFAKKYIWWKQPKDALLFPDRIAAQVMDIGDYDDVLALMSSLGEDYLRTVISHAEAGQFSARSWSYWHYKLGLAELGQVPALPKRMVQ